MKGIVKTQAFFLTVIMGVLLAGGVCFGQISAGQTVPAFSLKDFKDQTYDVAQMKERPMVILYFFDVDSRPSQEGLFNLDQLAKHYKEADMRVWAITLSPKEKVASFAASTGLGFPILIDQSGVSDRFEARTILPTVCIIGPGLAVLDYFQGGGKTTDIMLVRLAERELQRQQTSMAKAITTEVIKKDPHNVKARTVMGYAALKEHKLPEAEEVFKGLSQKGAPGEVLGKEGLAAVYSKKGEQEEALRMVREVEQQAPERSYVHVIKGDLLYAQDKKKEAEAEYQSAIQKKVAEPYQSAVKYNQMGRLLVNAAQYEKARQYYDQAVTIDPYYIEGTTNKGITYEKEGKWDKALEAYRQALALQQNDTFAATLAKNAQEMLDLQRDVARKKRVDQLVKDLVARYQTQKEARPKAEDAWTSPPMVLSFVDFQEKGGLAERDGFSAVLTSQLADHLNASGRVRVVERVLIERLLEELNLGSSDLADPETALKLGRVLAARLIGTGSLFYLPQGTLLSFRLIDTETTAIPQVTTKQLGSQMSVDKDLFDLNREILKTVIMKYPLRGYLVKVTGDQAMVNLGSKQGVVMGTKFEVLEEQAPVVYKGKELASSPTPTAQLAVARVEPDLCYVRVLSQEKPLQADAKVQEKIEETALR